MEENVTFDKKSLRRWKEKAFLSELIRELSKDCVAFANTNGGVLALGIEDDADSPDAQQHIPKELPGIITKRLNENTINVAISHEIITAENGGQYIRLQIHPSVSIASTSKGQYYIRDHDSSRPLMPDELSRLISDKPSYSWETKVSEEIPWQKAEWTKIKSFINDIQKSNRASAFVKEKNEEELLSYYQMIDEKGHLTHLGVLWLGKAEQRARLLYSPIVQYIKYDNEENKIAKLVWDDYRLNPKELLESIWQSIPDWKEINEVSEDLWRKEIPAYDEKVVRELLCNAIVHRPYTTRGDIFIKIFPDRMEIINPGRLPVGVTANNILQKTQKRNLHLSKVFYDLHLMEAEGSGYDLIYETLLAAGKDKPKVIEGDDSVNVTISRNIITKEASRLYEYTTDHYKLSRKSYIALGVLLKEKNLSAIKLAQELQLSANDRLRSYVEALVNHQIILTAGKGKSTTYRINPLFVNNARLQIPTTLKTIEPHRLKALILEDLRFYPNSLLSEIANRLPDVELTKLEKAVHTMAKNNELSIEGGRKFRRYRLP